MYVHGADSPTGEPRLRLEITLRLKPEVLDRVLSDAETLVEIGQRMSTAVTIDTDDVEVLGMHQTCFREVKAPELPDFGKFAQEILDRMPPKKGGEPWEGGDGV